MTKATSKDEFKLTFHAFEKTSYMTFLLAMSFFHKYHVMRERERDEFEDFCPWALSPLICELVNGYAIDYMAIKYIDLGLNTILVY